MSTKQEPEELYSPFRDAPGTSVVEITDCGHVQKQDGADAFKIEVRVIASATPALHVGTEWCLFREILDS